MSQSKVVSYINKLDQKQKERFRQFVFSPYFNQHEKTQKLLTLILDHKKKRKGEFDRQYYFKALFPDAKKYDEQKLFNVMSYLNRLFYKFLACERLEADEVQEKLFILEQARSQGMHNVLDNRGKYLEKKMRQQQQVDPAYYYGNFRLHYLTGFNLSDGLVRKEQDTMQAMLDNFDKYYISEKLRLVCHLYSDMQAKNFSFDFSYLDELMHYLRENWSKFEHDLYIRLYFTMFMSQKDPDPYHYKQLKDILAKNLEELKADDQLNLYKAAYNYCVVRINQGDNYYRMELFELYQQGLAKKLLIENGVLSEWVYKNIITVGSVTRHFDWTENFIEDYKDFLPADKRENAYTYNKAAFFFHREQYDEVRSLLINVQFTDVKYHINATLLLLRTYYKTMDTEALLSLIETFRIFIMRNKEIQANQKKGYTNFLRFKKRLVNIKHNKYTFSVKEYEDRLEALKKDIERTEPLMNEYWLINECQP